MTSLLSKRLVKASTPGYEGSGAPRCAAIIRPDARFSGPAPLGNLKAFWRAGKPGPPTAKLRALGEEIPEL